MKIIIFTQSLIKEHSPYLEMGRHRDLSVKKKLRKGSFQSSLTAVLQCILKHCAQIGNSCLHAITD